MTSVQSKFLAAGRKARQPAKKQLLTPVEKEVFVGQTNVHRPKMTGKILYFPMSHILQKSAQIVSRTKY